MILPKKKKVLSNVSPRNFVLQVLAISLVLYIKCKSIRELVLVTNCILSAFSDNRLVMNYLFISRRMLLAPSVKFIGLRLVIMIELLHRCY
jgi:hypothetical protein